MPLPMLLAAKISWGGFRCGMTKHSHSRPGLMPGSRANWRFAPALTAQEIYDSSRAVCLPSQPPARYLPSERRFRVRASRAVTFRNHRPNIFSVVTVTIANWYRSRKRCEDYRVARLFVGHGEFRSRRNVLLHIAGDRRGTAVTGSRQS